MRFPGVHAVATTPAQRLGAHFAHFPSRISLPRSRSRVGLRIVLFEACSAFTHVTACTLARSPIRDSLHQRLQPFRYLHSCSGCFRLERLPGGAFTHWEKRRLTTAHPRSRRSGRPQKRGINHAEIAKSQRLFSLWKYLLSPGTSLARAIERSTPKWLLCPPVHAPPPLCQSDKALKSLPVGFWKIRRSNSEAMARTWSKMSAWMRS